MSSSVDVHGCSLFAMIFDHPTVHGILHVSTFAILVAFLMTYRTGPTSSCDTINSPERTTPTPTMPS
jgi:hypothetical protein